MPSQARVVIIGAGFGGFQAAQSLAGADIEVLLIDRNNYHTFVPLLYQVATAQIEPTLAAYSVRPRLRRLSARQHLRSPHLQFLMTEVKQVDFGARLVETDHGVIPYDYLVLATGSQTRLDIVPGAADYAFTLRSLDEAIALRNHLIHCFEAAIREADPAQRQQLLTFVVVGGGATGVEMAGALVELITGPMQRDYPALSKTAPKIILLQSGDTLLPDLPTKLGDYACRKLRQIGVKIHLQTRVQQVIPTGVALQGEEAIAAATVIWTAGQEATPPTLSEPIDTAAKNKVRVQPTLQLPERPEVYAIGDLAYVEQKGKPLTGVAPEALQEGVAVARNIRRQLRGKAPQPFHYLNKGRLAIIGCYAGVGKIGGFAFTGFLAWLMWLGVHVVYLPGYRNRLLVLLTWLYVYLWRDRPLRFIVPTKATRVLRGQSTTQQEMFHR